MEINFEDAAGYLAAHISGEYSLAEMIEMIDQIAKESATRQAKRVLVCVCRMTGNASGFDRFTYASYAARVLGQQLERCAACAGPDGRVDYLTEDTAVNRGLQLRVFGHMSEAVEWLGTPLKLGSSVDRPL